ncbi:cation transporter, partial [Paenibacillus phytohabitans]
MNTVQGNVKRKWVLEGLDCANCAMKIENKVKKIEGVSSCSVNFAMKTMTLETAASAAEEVAEQAQHTVTALEPHVKLREVTASRAVKKPLAAGSPGQVRRVATQGQEHDHPGGEPHSHAQDDIHGHAHAAAEHTHSHPSAAEHGHDHSHGHSHEHGEGGTRRILLRLAGGAVLAAAGMFLPVSGIAELLI